MATLQEMERALVAADKAGATEDAKMLAQAIMAARQGDPSRAEIPATDPAGPKPAAAAPAAPQPKPGIVDQAVGTGEAALTAITGATGGAFGYLQGLGAGLAQAILSGQFGTADAAKMAEQAAAKNAQDLTYSPRTPAGQEQAAAVGQFVSDVVTPAAAVLPGMAGATGALGTLIKQAGKPAAAAAAQAVKAAPAAAAERVAALATSAATTLPRRAREALAKDPAPTPGTMGSAGAAGADRAMQRQQVGADFPVPIPALTKGQATRNPAQLKFEVESAKMPAQGAPLRDRYVAQNGAILRNFDAWVDQTGAQAPSLRAVGTAVDSALVKQAARDKTEIRTAYKAAENAGEMEAPVMLDNVVWHLVDNAPEAVTAPVLNMARAKALQLGVAVDQGGQLVPQAVPLKTAELFRRSISNAAGYDPTNVRQATILKGLIDETTAGKGGDLYKQARAARARYAQNYENRAGIAQLLNTKRGTADRRVALEDVLDHSILRASLDDVRNMRRVLQRGGPEGEQAWRELQGGTLRHIREKSTSASATNGAGDAIVLPDGMARAVRELDADGRLDFIFGKKGAQQMRDAVELAQIAKTVPPEAAINLSNSATTLMFGIGDIAGYGMSGVPVPLATLGRAAWSHIKDARLRRRIEDALNGIEKKQAPNNRRGAPPVQEPPTTLH